MKVIEETITVLRDIEEPGLTLFMGGYRVALTMAEARALVSGVEAALAGASDAVGEAEPAAAGEGAADRAAIVANVRDQVISWAQIAKTVPRK